jgi:8-oxo-dGTP pyrophosphatase MutT (NUDIX family)
MQQEQEKILKDAVLVFLVKDGQVLLATKMKKIGKGKLNSYGGGIEEGETPVQAVIRELEEETRGDKVKGILVEPKDMEKVGIMNFHNTTEEGITFVCKVHMFIARYWHGEIISTEDLADPKWYSIDAIPADHMMPADAVWLPEILKGRKIVGFAKYTPHQASLIGEVKITYVDVVPEQ